MDNGGETWHNKRVDLVFLKTKILTAQSAIFEQAINDNLNFHFSKLKI
ncbi:MAG TPA: hypothetical protein VNI60_08760 [Pyrinomonadaceae bacterium]|nr:hypothetical protein [Pyrinomonadaceae bacterium]